MRIQFLFLFLFGSLSLFSQQFTQNIKGIVTDKNSKIPLPGANIILIDTINFKGTATDINGFFKLEGIPLGRQSIRISYLGYREKSAQVVLTSGKEAMLNIELEESVIEGKEIVIVGTQDKTSTNNKMTSVSSRSFSIDETNRYAGSRGDPSRMAANFAGVSGANDARNDIIIRGNSPQGVLWRLNGVDIPNPNHFGSAGTTGGPVSMLNNNILDQSDFLTGAFPADYGNVTAGVFDLRMRNGNNEKKEYLGQIGLNGFELGAEGPINKEKGQSYLINYRYSTLGAFKALGINFGTGTAVPQYQDVSFNFSLPTKNFGKFNLFGIGGKSYVELLESKKDTSQTNLYSIGSKDVYYGSDMGVAGLSHLYLFKNNLHAKTSIAISGLSNPTKIETVEWINKQPKIYPNYDQEFKQGKISINHLINKKFNARNNLVIGLIGNQFRVTYKDSLINDSTGIYTRLRDYNGTTNLIQAYTSWQHKFSDKLTLNSGIHFQYFDLNNSNSIEPRVGLKWQLDEKQTIGLGTGFHSQTQPLFIYFSETSLPDGSYVSTNKNLDFTRSRHLIASYDNLISSNFRLKAETYLQFISNVPVTDSEASFSMLNSGADFGNPNIDSLVNKGKGENYGIELTLEKFYSKGYYFLITSSIFNSKYTGSDGKTRNTAFNGNYVLNGLIGKEIKIKENHLFSVDFRLTRAGGKRYIPINLEQSISTSETIREFDKAYVNKYKDYFRMDLKITYKINGKKISQEWLIDTQNITNHKNIFIEMFDPQSGKIRQEYQLGIFFVPQYRILF
jgi:hypothetical protein